MKKVLSESKKMINNLCYLICNAFNIQKSIIVFSITCALIAIIINLLKLIFVPVILDTVNAESPITLLLCVSAFIIVWMALDSVQTYINANIIFGRIELKSFFTFRIHTKMANTSYPNTEKKDFLDVLDRAYNAVASNDGAVVDIWNVFTQLIQSIIGLIIYTLLLTNIDGWLVLITVVTSVCSYLFKIKANKWVYDNKEREAELSRKMSYINRVAQKLPIAKDIRLYDMKSWLKSIKEKDFANYKSFMREKEGQYARADIKKLLLNVFRSGFSYIYIILFMTQNHLTISFFLLMLNAVTGFDAWIDGLFSAATKLNEYSIQITYIRECLDYDEIFLFDEGKTIEQSECYGIQLKNISYSYPNSNKECIKDFNLEISPGEKLAIVGANGAGKTTLVKLICGLLEPDAGEILLNGRNIKYYNRKQYYQLFSCVFQNSSLLAGTIACNIAQAFDKIDMDKVKQCSEKAGFLDKAMNLPEQFETKIGKEVYEDSIELSGGELQSLLLARALYKNGSILILDEPTAALDPVAEANIYQKYNEISANKMSIYISHRLASTKFCDKILLIDDGRIVEQGTHDELMNNKGKYYELFVTQRKYYQEG